MTISGILAILFALPLPAVAQGLRIDTAESDAVLAILAGGNERPRLLASEGYTRLKKREASMGRTFSDADFQAFLDSPALPEKRDALAATLREWKRADIEAIGERVRAFLPAEAKLKATVYIVIKPQSNSFVFDLKADPAIFLYLDPAKTRAQFENTVAHELHHIGLASLPDRTDPALPSKLRAAVEWLGAFGEGLAMLAAAGSPEVHPHRDSPPEDRARWDRDSKNLAHDMRAVEGFLIAVAKGELDENQRREKGMSFFGTQGPWYTVGWRMAVTVEQAKGRAELLECMRDMRRLLFDYNDAAKAAGFPQWSEELINAFRKPL
uniref:DUF2268 domain-containing protein n=1 Tax=Solibacter usitatus (strain Ellin6076) TaxID=234267 RepID=Q02CV2_SOLUE